MILTPLNPPTRKVGVELEFNGIKLLQTLELIADILSQTGEVTREVRNDYHHYLHHSELGRFAIEVDFRLLQELSENKTEDSWHHLAQAALSPLAEPIAPLEIVTPPLPSDQLAIVEQIITALRDAGAKGTGDSLMSAYGMHINIEFKGDDAAKLTAYLQSFCLLYEWLKAKMKLDVSRSISTYISPYASDYFAHILRRNYQPDLPQLIDDYLHFNPSRNYALDMLPLFGHLDKMRIMAIMNNPLIKTRPAFHFRMPDCRIDELDWSFGHAWNHWQKIEQVAQNDKLRQKLLRLFEKDSTRFFHAFDSGWVSMVERVMGDD